MSVGVVYANQKRRKNKAVYTNVDYKKEKKPFVKIQYNLIKDISGDFIPDKKHWIPAISKYGENNELKLKKSGYNFAFWDRRGLTIPLVTGYKGETSCGPSSSNTLLPNQYYLQFKKNGRTIGMEIISGPEDQLVHDWTEIYASKAETKINRFHKSYFSEMSGYQEIELRKCPTKDERNFIQFGRGVFSDEMDVNPQSLLPSNIFKQYSYYNSRLEDLKIINLLAYQNQINRHGWQCNASARYLVLDKLSQKTNGRSISSFHVNSPQHRYVEIRNGKIDTREILSNIKILPDEDGNTKIDISKVKKWIREASPQTPSP